MFVRKRDPRYKAYTAHQARSTEQASTAPASGTATPKRSAPTCTFVAQDWQKVAEPSDAAADLEWVRAEGAENEEWECVACNKTFRSEAAWSSHERSKKHLRAVEQLKREMQDEELELDLIQGGDKVADKVQEESDEDPVMAGADITVDGSGGDNGPPEATPDRMSGPIPKEGGDATEEDVSPRRPGRQPRTQETAHTSLSPSPSPTPPAAAKTSRKGRARAVHRYSRPQQTDGDPVFSEDNCETTLTPGESHHVRNGGDEDDDGAVTANSTKRGAVIKAGEAQSP
jgi:DnaJ family protein A protein 5